MGLETVGGKRITATKAEESRHIVKARAKWPSATFEAVVRHLDKEIDKRVMGPGRAWLNTASLVGDHAPIPHQWYEHLWGNVLSLFPKVNDPVAEKARRITVGAFVAWRIAVRPEPWLVFYRETGKEDIVTGDEILAGEYWIDTSGARRSAEHQKATLNALRAKFNRT